VVRNHEGGTRGGRQPDSEAKVATPTRDADSSAPETVEGRSLETRTRQSTGGPDEPGRWATIGAGRQGRVNGAIRASGRHDDDADETEGVRTARKRGAETMGSSSSDEAHEGESPESLKAIRAHPME